MSAAPHLAIPEAGIVPGAAPAPDLLDDRALAFLAGLHQRFERPRRALLAARRERQTHFDRGGLPDFRADTHAIREGDWTVAPLPAARAVRRLPAPQPRLPLQHREESVSAGLTDHSRCGRAAT